MPRSLHSLDLLFPESATTHQAGNESLRYGVQHLWVAVCLPSLALECFASRNTREPTVVVEAEQGLLRVVACSQEAIGAGIKLGMKLSTALTLAASLQVVERDLERERAGLESLAGWAETLTSMVSIVLPESLLLEVSGSIKLFGTLEAIKTRLHEELLRRRLEFRSCVAPTPTAALWLARAASEDVLARHELPGRLGALPLRVTHWPQTILTLLRDLGARTVGDCLRLPRNGFARRVGRAPLAELDRAVGRQFDLRAGFKARDTWSSTVELHEESVDSAVFVEAIELIFDELVAHLRRRQAEIADFELAFAHLHRPPTVEHFACLEPTHDRDRLLLLVRDRLERSLLPVPAIAIRVSSGVLLPLVVREAGLFERAPVEELARVLLERLRGRFGSEAVYGMRTIAEHRPERAWSKSIEIESLQARSGGRFSFRQSRPLWLLPEPLPLSSFETRPASLELCKDPERIESGWWDDQDTLRDYYTACNTKGQRLWIFRDRRTRSWFLHGLFG